MRPEQDLCDQAAALHKAGRLAEAAALYDQVLAATPQDYAALYQTGIIRFQQQQWAQALPLFDAALAAKPDAVSAHVMRGLVLQSLGQPEWALESYDRALALDAVNVSAFSNRGISLKDLNRLPEALDSFDRALALKPEFAAALINRGNILREMNRAEAALDAYDKALALQPDTVEVLAGRGHLLLDRGEIDAAIASHRKALTLNPGLIDATIGLGNALLVKGELAEAESCYRRAGADPVAAENLGLLLSMRGDAAGALEIVKPLLQAGGHAGKLFADAAGRVPARDDAQMRGLLARALTEAWARPSELAQTAAAHLHQRMDETLLNALLITTPNADPALEKYLTDARRTLLTEAETDDDTDRLDFYTALARQCFINDYVFARDEDEIGRAEALRERLVAVLEADIPVSPLLIAAVAAYFPLGSVAGAERLLQHDVQALLQQQIVEPQIEQDLRATIPRLTAIAQSVSQQVQAQYEESPYPRWVAAPPAIPVASVSAYLARKFPLAPFRRGGDSNALLIAGCGTGQHSVSTARKFPAAKILAIDLSLASLAYAKRQSPETIDYAQADLLELRDRRFDVIESVGVLHHLADPFAGWRSLLGLLRPGGFMMLGFYSATARRGIAEARTFIAEQGFGVTPDDIRACRQQMLAQPDRFRDVLAAPDFYSTSSCRDLLFHVQEQRLSLAQIAAFLKQEALTFIGFEADASVLQAYRQSFPNDPAATDLAQWERFETANPSIFAGMYQFWVQKAD